MCGASPTSKRMGFFIRVIMLPYRSSNRQSPFPSVSVQSRKRNTQEAELMRTSRCHPIRALLVLGALSGGLAACSGGGDSAAPTQGVVPPPGGGPPPPGVANVVFARNVATSPPPNLDLFLVKEDGTGMVPLASAAPQVEVYVGATGSKVIYLACNPFNSRCDLQSVNQDGSGVLPLAMDIRPAPILVVGGRIVYGKSVGGPSGQNDIYSVAPTGGSPVELAVTTDNENLIAGAVVGTRVVYVRRTNGQNDLYSVDVSGGGGSAPLGISAADETFRGLLSNRVLFERTVAGQGDVFSVTADGGDLRNVATTPDDETIVGQAGDRLVYARRVSGQDDLWSVNADGASPLPLTTAPEDESFEGASSSLVFYKRTVNGQGDLYSVPVLGGAVSTLAVTLNDEDFQGIVNNRVIYSVRMSVDNNDLRAVDLTGGNDTGLAVTADNEVYAGGIGNRVVFVQCGPLCDVMTVGTDGSGKIAVANSANQESVRALTSSRILYVEEIAGQKDLFAISPDGTGRIPLASTTLDEDFAGLF